MGQWIASTSHNYFHWASWSSCRCVTSGEWWKCSLWGQPVSPVHPEQPSLPTSPPHEWTSSMQQHQPSQGTCNMPKPWFIRTQLAGRRGAPCHMPRLWQQSLQLSETLVCFSNRVLLCVINQEWRSSSYCLLPLWITMTFSCNSCWASQQRMKCLIILWSTGARLCRYYKSLALHLIHFSSFAKSWHVLRKTSVCLQI